MSATTAPTGTPVATRTADLAAEPTAAHTAEEGVGEASLFGSLRRPVSLIGGIAMLAAPLLIVGGIVTSPPQESRAMGDYITSLARDPFLSSLSLNLLHYGWVAMALGFVVAMSLVRGRKGRVLTLLGGVVGGFSIVQMSALMYNDWVLSALGNNVDLASAVRVAEAYMTNGDLSAQFAWKCATAALVLPVLLYAGLARAGVISWFLVPLSLFPMVLPYVAMGLVGGDAGATVVINPLAVTVGALVGLACYAPTFLVGLRLIARGRLAKA
jgi:hypothetical protein